MVDGESSLMNVVFLPWYPDNPYQKELAGNLSARGVNVTAMAAPDFIKPASVWRTRPDILHLHWLQQFVIASNIIKSWVKFGLFISHLLVLKSRGVKIVWTAHDLGDHEKQNPFLDRLVTKWVARISHRVITHCENAKQLLVEELALRNPDSVSVVPLGNYVNSYPNTISREEARGRLGIPGDRFVLLFIGLIKPYKGVEELIDSVKRLESTALQLVIVGRPYREDFGDAIRSKVDGQDNILFEGEFKPDEELQVYMNACDVTVFPYRAVLSSSSVLLSMTFGRPCIAPRIGCIPEDLDEETSFLYDSLDKDGLYNAIRSAMDRRTELPQLGERNRQRAENASWDHIAKKTEMLYQTVAGTIANAGGS